MWLLDGVPLMRFLAMMIADPVLQWDVNPQSPILSGLWVYGGETRPSSHGVFLNSRSRISATCRKWVAGWQMQPPAHGNLCKNKKYCKIVRSNDPKWSCFLFQPVLGNSPKFYIVWYNLIVSKWLTLGLGWLSAKNPHVSGSFQPLHSTLRPWARPLLQSVRPVRTWSPGLRAARFFWGTWCASKRHGKPWKDAEEWWDMGGFTQR